MVLGALQRTFLLPLMDSARKGTRSPCVGLIQPHSTQKRKIPRILLMSPPTRETEAALAVVEEKQEYLLVKMMRRLQASTHTQRARAFNKTALNLLT